MKNSTECNCMKGIELMLKTHQKHLENKPMTLKEKLMLNRSKMGTGSGDEYWDSVVDLIQEHIYEGNTVKHPKNISKLFEGEGEGE